MIQENQVSEAVRQAAPSVAASSDSVSAVARVEPCDFEKLLERAMNILSARHLDKQLKAKRI